MLQFRAEGAGQTLKTFRIPLIKGGRHVRTEPHLKGGLSQFEERHTHMGNKILPAHHPVRSIGKRVFCHLSHRLGQLRHCQRAGQGSLSAFRHDGRHPPGKQRRRLGGHDQRQGLSGNGPRPCPRRMVGVQRQALSHPFARRSLRNRAFLCAQPQSAHAHCRARPVDRLAGRSLKTLEKHR